MHYLCPEGKYLIMERKERSTYIIKTQKESKYQMA